MRFTSISHLNVATAFWHLAEVIVLCGLVLRRGQVDGCGMLISDSTNVWDGD
jgi:hypothetical protein